MKLPFFINSIIFPSKLKDIDRYLLLHYPRLWITKIYYLFYWALLSNVILTLIIFVFPIKPHHIDDFWNIELGIFCIEILCLIIWLIQQSFFNIEKQYGNTSIVKSWLEISTYMICIFLILSTSLFFPFTVKNVTLKEVPEIDLALDRVVIDVIYYNHLYQSIRISTIIEENFNNISENKLSEEKNTFSILNRYLKTKKFQELKIEIEEDKRKKSNFKFPDVEYSNIRHQYLEQALNSKELALLSLSNKRTLVHLEEIMNKENFSKDIIEKSIISRLYKSIESQQDQEIIDLINKFSSANITKVDIGTELYNKAVRNAYRNSSLLHHFYYWNNFEYLFPFYDWQYQLNGVFNYSIIFIHFSIFLLLFKHIDDDIFVLSLLLLSIILLLMIFILIAIASLVTGDYKISIFLSYFMTLLLFFLLYQSIDMSKLNKHSIINIINIIAFPITIVILVFVIIDSQLIHEQYSYKDLNHDFQYWWIFASFAYLPFVPLLKRVLLKLLSVPKQ